MDLNDKDMFVTLLFGVLNAITRQFDYVRAGHEPPVFVDPHRSVKRLPTGHGPALGVFDGIALDVQTVQLPKGCTLMLYADGITEATHRNNESFGFFRISRTLSDMGPASAQRICEGLIQAAAEHEGGSLPHDDMTVVVVRAT